MRVKGIRLKDFKRFKDLEVTNISPETKLVVLVGPNGCGKTSLFEAFNYVFGEVRRSMVFDVDYHKRKGSSGRNDWHTLRQQIDLQIHDVDLKSEIGTDVGKKRFYFRTAYRHEPDFSIASLTRLPDLVQDPRHPTFLFASENRVSDNYQRIVGQTIADVYTPGDDHRTKAQIRNHIIGKVLEAVSSVFTDLQLIGPGDPLNNGTFLFTKGSIQDFRYKNLSGGEKAAFDLLLDFIVKTETFKDTLYFIDEPELHMHTKLQGRLLEELVSRLPGASQLWISTHSIGMLHQAKIMQTRNPNEVAFLDFHDCDPDNYLKIEPSCPTRELWTRMFRVALDELVDLVSPSEIVFCEGSASKKSSDGWDARVLKRIFLNTRTDTDFISVGNDHDVKRTSSILRTAFSTASPGVRLYSLLDGDDCSPSERASHRSAGVSVLSMRDLESYLWADEILIKLCESCGKSEMASGVLAEKMNLIAASTSRGKPADDIKEISGDLYVFCKRELSLTSCGNTSREFAVATLAPLITKETNTYKKLAEDIFGAL